MCRHVCDMSYLCHPFFLFLFFFAAPATTGIYTLSLHDALPILEQVPGGFARPAPFGPGGFDDLDVALRQDRRSLLDRKSTRLNSSHVSISYAVFCLKKKICGRL